MKLLSAERIVLSVFREPSPACGACGCPGAGMLLSTFVRDLIGIATLIVPLIDGMKSQEPQTCDAVKPSEESGIQFVDHRRNRQPGFARIDPGSVILDR